MKIVDAEVIPYRIPNRRVHHIATLTLSAIENVLIRLRTDDGVEGIGEAVSEAKWNSTVLEAHEVLLRKYLVPAVLGKDPFDLVGIWRAMDGVVNGQYSAKSAIDTALHDLIGRALGIPVWRYMGGAARQVIEVEGPGFGIGFMDPADEVEMAVAAVEKGCRQIELKGGHPEGWRRDLTGVEAVRKACGPDVSLKIDITEAYSLKTAMQALPRFAELGVDWVEQPLPQHALADLARLRQTVPVGIMLEETIGHPADVLLVAHMGAADAIHVKLPMLGGPSKARQIAAICEAAGLGIQAGTSTASGLAAVHQFAATVPNLVRGCHGSPLARAVDDIVTSPVDAYAPTITMTDRPGLGVEVDWDKVRHYEVGRD